ncbi:acyl-CoA thioesterase II [Fonsecaea erecta]|uniref:Acyl-CoA thioesterase II n=1 Tax=Fonsecaea erecta TaxID=1367422 RepID=A0A178Z5B7_9EURO|nr:acyl-CoA thioesterase II [Fonsecaea erecta]OAP54968.1 acyl-CoA thioesterase II [Fonsecaea erecta]
MAPSEESASKQLDFETHLELKQTAPDVFTNAHEPWVFHVTHTYPGPLMMAQAAAAAWKTVPDGFMLDSLQTHFMLAPSPAKPLKYHVQRIGNGRRFAVRIVNISQDDKICVTITTSFVNDAAPWSGRAMTHAVPMRIDRRRREITLDDFEFGRTERGPFMKFERLPHVHQGWLVPFQQARAKEIYYDTHMLFLSPFSAPKSPATTIAPTLAQIAPAISSPRGTAAHVLAVVHVSDYHVMDCPLSIHGIAHGSWAIGDQSKTPIPSAMKIMTSLNHTIHFHTHNGFRADEVMYIEVTSPWAKDGRAMINSRIFSKQGMLIATVVQEAFYVFKDAGAKL